MNEFELTVIILSTVFAIVQASSLTFETIVFEQDHEHEVLPLIPYRNNEKYYMSCSLHLMCLVLVIEHTHRF